MAVESSIPALLAAQAARDPAKPALAVAGERVAYGELVERVAALAGWLAAHGVAPGDRVLIGGQSSVNLVIACLAAMWVGGAEVVANPSLTRRELRHFLDDAEPAAILADVAELDKLGDALLAGRRVAALDGAPEGVPGLLGSPPADAPRAPVARLDGRALASLQYTSGTTGVPKGAALTHGNLVAYLQAIHAAWEWSADDVLLHSLPLSHGHGRNAVYTALLAGASTVVLPRTDPSAIFAALVEERASVLYAVPAIWERLLSAPGFDPAAFAALRLYTSGSAPLSPALSDEVAARLGRERPLERYGCTETGIVTTNPLHGPRVAGTVGLPVPGAEVRVVGPDGAPLPGGATGEIVARGPSVFAGYWRREDAELFLPGGWFRTGDLGFHDPDRGGHLVVSGRSKELIITGGLNVYPREVELVAEASTAVREAAAVGIPSERWGEQVVLAVVAEDSGASVDGEELIAWMRERLAAYKVPKACKVVAKIPRNGTGKILRAELTRGWDAL